MEFYKKQNLSIRKLSLGVCSVLVGIALLSGRRMFQQKRSTDLSQASDVALVNADARRKRRQRKHRETCFRGGKSSSTARYRKSSSC